MAERLRLYRALILLTGDRAEAEDLMQEAFVRLWERWERVGSTDDPVGYLYRTALNGFRARVRRAALAARRRFRPAVATDPFEQVEERDALARVLKAATARQRTAVVLTEVLAFTSDEAARVMGVSAVTVRRLAGKARDAMRECPHGPRRDLDERRGSAVGRRLTAWLRGRRVVSADRGGSAAVVRRVATGGQ
jgi:RNA polymerase sigma-70 factor, ECF subfamily